MSVEFVFDSVVLVSDPDEKLSYSLISVRVDLLGLFEALYDWEAEDSDPQGYEFGEWDRHFCVFLKKLSNLIFLDFCNFCLLEWFLQV